jgi:hypothetical protein
MNAVPFDTLKLARRLEAAGMDPAVAAGTSEALADAMDGGGFAMKADVEASEIAVRADIDALQRKLDADIAAVRAEMAGEFRAVRGEMASEFKSVRAEMTLLRRDMTIKLGSMLMVSVGVILTAMRLMPHP